MTNQSEMNSASQPALNVNIGSSTAILNAGMAKTSQAKAISHLNPGLPSSDANNPYGDPNIGDTTVQEFVLADDS